MTNGKRIDKLSTQVSDLNTRMYQVEIQQAKISHKIDTIHNDINSISEKSIKSDTKINTVIVIASIVLFLITTFGITSVMNLFHC